MDSHADPRARESCGDVALAVRLFDEGQISLGMAAELACLSQVDFMRHLAAMGLAVIRTTSEELHQELAAFDCGPEEHPTPLAPIAVNESPE
jgi:predicted HTH domain antitoxin